MGHPLLLVGFRVDIPDIGAGILAAGSVLGIAPLEALDSLLYLVLVALPSVADGGDA